MTMKDNESQLDILDLPRKEIGAPRVLQADELMHVVGGLMPADGGTADGGVPPTGYMCSAPMNDCQLL